MFSFTSIGQYHQSLLEGTQTCVRAVDYYLQKIEASRRLNAFTVVYAKEALEQAQRLDQRRREGQPMGRLHGVIIGIKDVIAYKDHPLTAASGILSGFHSLYNATAVERLLAEEAIIIGSLNCDEFAMGSTNENSVYGKVLNAKDKTRVPGGSSGGSAVAVQAGLCMASLGSDTGGSVRQPADFCGIIGLKPTYGRISRHGLIAYASSFDQIGIFASTIPDTALLLEIMSGTDEYDSTVSGNPVPAYTAELNKPAEKYRIAWFPEALDHPSIDPEISGAIRSKLNELAAEGHLVQAESFQLLDYIVPAYYVLTTAEASSNLSRYDGIRFGHRTDSSCTDLTVLYKKSRSEGFGREVKRRIMLGTFVLSAGYYDAYFTRAQKVRRLLFEQIDELYKSYDFVIMPVSPVTAFKSGEKMDDPIAMYLADIYTVMANLVGCPAIALPLFTHSGGMPFGLQVMAARFDELSLLKFAQQLCKS